MLQPAERKGLVLVELAHTPEPERLDPFLNRDSVRKMVVYFNQVVTTGAGRPLLVTHLGPKADLHPRKQLIRTRVPALAFMLDRHAAHRRHKSPCRRPVCLEHLAKRLFEYAEVIFAEAGSLC